MKMDVQAGADPCRQLRCTLPICKHLYSEIHRRPCSLNIDYLTNQHKIRESREVQIYAFTPLQIMYTQIQRHTSEGFRDGIRFKLTWLSLVKRLNNLSTGMIQGDIAKKKFKVERYGYLFIDTLYGVLVYRESRTLPDGRFYA